MKIKPKQYAQALFALTKEANEQELDQILNKFAQLLYNNNQSSQIEKIASYFFELWNKENAVIEAEVISAHKADEQIIELLKDYMQQRLVNKEIRLEQKIDRKIIGGFIIRYNDIIIDSSLRNRIRQLKTKLNY